MPRVSEWNQMTGWTGESWTTAKEHSERRSDLLTRGHEVIVSNGATGSGRYLLIYKNKSVNESLTGFRRVQNVISLVSEDLLPTPEAPNEQ